MQTLDNMYLLKEFQVLLKNDEPYSYVKIRALDKESVNTMERLEIVNGKVII